MKKISMLFLSLMIIFLAVGCGETRENEVKEQTLVCTTTENDEDTNSLQVISMTFKNDKLKRMTMEVNTKVIDSTVKDNWGLFKKSMNEQNKEFNKDGISLKVSVDDENYEYDTILDIDVENATEEALKEQGFEGLKDDESTLEENKELAEKDGASCEIK